MERRSYRAEAVNGEAGPRSGSPLLTVRDLTKTFPVRKGLFGRPEAMIQAVTDVSFSIYPGQTLGLVGESGSGKSTTALCVTRLLDVTSGSVVFDGQELSDLSRRSMRPIRRNMQIVFQDPYSSLDPRMTVKEIIAEPLRVYGSYGRRGQGERKVHELLEKVGMNAADAARFPHEFSGGQRQRISIARALALEPRLLVLDEPVSALDVSVQAQVTNLLRDLQEAMGLAYLFIAHDLAVVHHVSDWIAVMYLGKIVEYGTVDQVFSQPTHPYTQALLSAIPSADPTRADDLDERIILTGEIPDPADPPSGCRFRTRCWKAEPTCEEVSPELVDTLGVGHPSACHFPELQASGVHR
ncbi:MAG: ATP-binding cassette domain-containing protein [bacterium]|nr:ATP-binding cassette domain-containing protein [bacterium]